MGCRKVVFSIILIGGLLLPLGISLGGQTAKPLQNINLQAPFEELDIPRPEFKNGDVRFSKIKFTCSMQNYGPAEMDPLRVYVAIPVERANQEFLQGMDFSEEPEVLTDEWGQEVAFYEEVLEEGEQVEYTYEVVVKTTDYDYGLVQEEVGDFDDIPQEIKDAYTVDAEYYDITNPVIVNAADEAVGSETDYYLMVMNIHDYVIAHLSYVLDGRWDPAPQVLTQEHGSCTEYTWLMIALCRAKGIPARYVGGTCLSGTPPYRDEVFHRWDEIYFPNYGWVSIDCTWDDKPSDQHRYFGRISNRLFGTTVVGGPSEYLRWNYHCDRRFWYSGSLPDYDWSRYFDWESSPGIDEKVAARWEPTSLRIFPNPFSVTTNISFSLQENCEVTVTLWDISGRLIKILKEGTVPAGTHTILWDRRDSEGRQAGPGIYFCTVATSAHVLRTKLVVLD